MEIRERDQEEWDEMLGWFIAPLVVYLVGTLSDERGDLVHHHVHTLQTGSFQFEDLLFHHGLEGQVGGEEPRSERSGKREKSRVVEREGDEGEEKQQKEKKKKKKRKNFS